MKPSSFFTHAILDGDVAARAEQNVWSAGKPESINLSGDGTLTAILPHAAMRVEGWSLFDDARVPALRVRLTITAFGPEVLRITAAPDGVAVRPIAGPMLTPDAVPPHQPLCVRRDAVTTCVIDDAGAERARIDLAEDPVKPWRNGLVPEPQHFPRLMFRPDGVCGVPLLSVSKFHGPQYECLPLAFTGMNGTPDRATFSLHAEPGECFYGTGERFAPLDLSGKTLQLENTDGLGVNNRRAYKNVPFFLSSRGYGVLLHTSYPVRLSFKDVCTRAVIGLVEEPVLDLFLVGGGSLEAILRNYRKLTGFPPELPRWTYGAWMSRMTYFSAAETEEVAGRLRKEQFPCDVIHLDTGWFDKDWVCEWTFNKERFPDPAAYMKRMKDDGFRITLWQNMNIGAGNKLLEEAKANRYLAPIPDQATARDSGSDFSAQTFGGQIDFSNPAAVIWYQGLLRNLLEMGAAAIKTDFGEDIDQRADFYGMSAQELHNLYALLYQKAAFDVTREVTGEGVIWARAGWTGCQRYPIHWGGDAACTWDGLAGSLRGGLQLGLSGFGYWSHDVPGFHGMPDFMSSWPTDNLYVRWTQFGVFSSHLRYHGTTPREPYEYPAVANMVREWLKLRYALIPYIEQQARIVAASGMPMLRAMVLHHPDDPVCRTLDDQYYFGEAFLVAPVMNDADRRDVYLPEGEWVNIWTGERHEGPVRMTDLPAELSVMPVFAQAGRIVPVYTEPIQHTGEMHEEKIGEWIIEPGRALADSPLSFIRIPY